MSTDTESTPAATSKLPYLRIFTILGVGLAVLISTCAFIVNETESAIVLRVGKPVRTILSPGMYLKLPVPFDRVVRLDRRLQHADIRLSETLTMDQRNIIVPMFFTWRIEEPLRFHTSVRDVATANQKLDTVITSARNSVLGRHEFVDLVGSDAGSSSLNTIEEEILALAAISAENDLGIRLISCGITSIQLPEANTESVFRRMRAERQREATRFRAEGRAKADEMKAEADRESSFMISEARAEAEKLRGKAEAEAAAIYAEAHSADPGFYRFLRELQSLRTVVDKNTTLVLDTSVAPLHWLKSIESEGESSPLKPPARRPEPDSNQETIPERRNLTGMPFPASEAVQSE